MWEDPIVAEVHRARLHLMETYNFDIKAMFADIRKRQESLGDRLVRLNKRSEEAVGHEHPACAVEATGTRSAGST